MLSARTGDSKAISAIRHGATKRAVWRANRRFFRRNHPVPLPQARDLEQLNELLREGSTEEEQRVIAGRVQSIGAAMTIEREHLRPLAEEGFDLAAYVSDRQQQRHCQRVDELLLDAANAGNQVEAKLTQPMWRFGAKAVRGSA